ncbi:HNH/ENDO VII family nuclease [Ruminococcus sp.]|uniref:HNH/ENDO VII family nuclease n=1 Tax=Ruminococcus sp. TaxID=41978 RepID=UPI0025F95712|nr:HNH/ENDO VII family nuclease [Ruminococcus sp.]
MKKALAILLSCAMLLTGCSLQDAVDTSSDNTSKVAEQTTVSDIVTTVSTELQVSNEQDDVSSTQAVAADTPLLSLDTTSEEYINTLGFTSLNDPNLMRYVEDTVYTDLVNQLDSDKYFVENVEAVYISKEYLDELAYNSQENIYFGYKLSELEEAFQGDRFIFTLGENGQTDVVPFEEYDDTYDKVIRNVAIGTGVILLCVTVSVVSGGVGAPAVSMIFAASAKSATVFALSSGVISGVSAGVVEGIQTHDFDKAVKAAALKGSEGYMWGAITGAITGGVSEAQTVSALKGADVTANGLTLQEAAKIQKDSKYPLDVIKQFKSMEEYQVYKEAGLTAQMVDGKLALMQNIDLNFKSTLPDGTEVTNLQRMLKGYAPLDSATGKAYQLHHIGQKADGTLAVLTEAQHQGNSAILNTLGKESEINRAAFDKVRKAFWENAGKLFQQGLK